MITTKKGTPGRTNLNIDLEQGLDRLDARLAEVLREERSRLVGALVRILGDWDAAEELVQDAAVAALDAAPAAFASPATSRRRVDSPASAGRGAHRCRADRPA